MATQTFESAMKKLEKIVEELESGELPLEKSLKKFEEGIDISRFCSEMLEGIEEKVTRLIKDSKGAPREVPADGNSKQEDM